MSRRLILWRHGRTAWNAAGRVQGQSDVPLDETGVAQASAAAARLATLGPSRIVSSDLMRAHDTAQLLADLTGLRVEDDPRLREMNFGVREGLTMPEALEQYPEEMTAWLANSDVRMPGGETYAEAAARFASGVRGVIAELADGHTAVVVAHGAVLRVGICEFLGIPQEYWRTFGGFNNCSWAALEEAHQGWRVAEWNAGTLPEPVLSDDS